MKRVSRRDLIRASAALACSFPGFAQAQKAWPVRPIKVVVPFPPGGASDLVIRVVAPAMTATLGQQIVVDNKAGAGGMLGADAVAKATGDGYTMGIATVSTHAIAPVLMRQPPYQPDADFTPIAVIASTAVAIFVHPSVGASLADLQDKARREPGKYNYASPGNGSLGHLAGLWFNSLTGGELVHVPYRGGAPALQDLVAGRVHVLFDNVPTALSQVESGSVRALAITAPTRAASLPKVPTTAEAGLPTFQITSWTMLVGPSQLKAGVIEAANDAVNSAIREAAVRERLAQSCVDVLGGSPQEAADFLKAEIGKWSPIAKASGVTLD